MNKIIFVDDFFVEQLLGGGELNNDEVIKCLVADGFHVTKINGRNITIDFLKQNLESFYIIGNFIGLSVPIYNFIKETCKYIIYEHDHKYLIDRNPSLYKDFAAPKEQIINIDFYAKAVAVFCQSSFHEKIILSNLSKINLVNLSGNMWSMSSLALLSKLSEKTKSGNCAVMNSPIGHKNTQDAVNYCKYKSLPYSLIESNNYETFLEKLSENSKLVFFPKTPETLSRIAVEARMMNMSVITNNNVGATYEDWFQYKGKDLINIMTEKRKQIIETIKEYITK